MKSYFSILVILFACCCLLTQGCHWFRKLDIPKQLRNARHRYLHTPACQQEYNVWYWALREKGMANGGWKGRTCEWFASYACVHVCMMDCMRGHIPSKPGAGCRIGRCLHHTPFWMYHCDCGTHPVTNKTCSVQMNYLQARGVATMCSHHNSAHRGQVWPREMPHKISIWVHNHHNGLWFMGARTSLNGKDFPKLADGERCAGLDVLCGKGKYCVWRRKMCPKQLNKPENCRQYKCIDF